ncbi:diguanylate cyclase domain-containing protein [Thalassospira profundimaris]|uniref:diguanylate cyclase domain-containing protein n=1 Tax=Thalassospira profundimaris TaxID=502049 RepID=UPI000DEE09F9|nr:diguanylate cyclase [Thalassospira profundimaris]
MKTDSKTGRHLEDVRNLLKGLTVANAPCDENIPPADSLLYFIDLACPENSRFSSNFTQMLGYDISDFIAPAADWWMPLVHPDDIGNLTSLATLPAELWGKTLTQRFRIQHENGEWLDVIDQAMKVPVAQNGGGVIVGTLRNPSIYRKISGVLQESNRRSRHLLETIPDGVMVYDARGKVVHSNVAAQKMLGLNAEQLFGLEAADNRWQAVDQYGQPLKPDDFPAVRALRGGEPVSGVVMGVKRGDDTRIWLRLNVQPLFAPDTGQSDGAVVSFANVSDLKNAESAIAERESLYRQMFDHSPAVKLLIDPRTGRIVDANRAACDFYGYDHVDLCGMVIAQINVSEGDAVAKSVREIVRKGAESYSFRHRLASGVIRDVRVHAGRIVLNGREYINSIVFDVTERNEYERRLIKANRQLQLERQRLDEIVRATNAGTWEWNIRTGEIRVNERWAEIGGYRLEELTPFGVDQWTSLCHRDDLDKIHALLNRHFDHETDHFDCEYRIKHKNGGWVWVLDRGKVFEWSDDGKPLRLSGTHSDVTLSKELEQRMRHMALSDPLTGLANRRRFEEYLSTAIAQCRAGGRHVILLLFDIDQFKMVNDTFGHPAGDALLVNVAERIRKQFRESDFIARLGGDEFAVLLTNVEDVAIAQKAAMRVIEETARPIKVEGQEIRVGVSIGISAGCEAVLPKTLYQCADRALYQAKEAGRNTFRVCKVREVD